MCSQGERAFSGYRQFGGSSSRFDKNFSFVSVRFHVGGREAPSCNICLRIVRCLGSSFSLRTMSRLPLYLRCVPRFFFPFCRLKNTDHVPEGDGERGKETRRGRPGGAICCGLNLSDQYCFLSPPPAVAFRLCCGYACADAYWCFLYFVPLLFLRLFVCPPPRCRLSASLVPGGFISPVGCVSDPLLFMYFILLFYLPLPRIECRWERRVPAVCF